MEVLSEYKNDKLVVTTMMKVMMMMMKVVVRMVAKVMKMMMVVVMLMMMVIMKVVMTKMMKVVVMMNTTRYLANDSHTQMDMSSWNAQLSGRLKQYGTTKYTLASCGKSLKGGVRV